LAPALRIIHTLRAGREASGKIEIAKKRFKAIRTGEWDMAILGWSTLEGGESYEFNPATDVLSFNGGETAGLGPDADSQLDFFVDPGPTPYFAFGGKEIGLIDVDPRKLHSSNVVFENGATDSLFIYGDDDVGTANDDKANTINGGAGGDWLIGAGGADSVFGGGGNDMLVVVGSGALGTGAYGNDTLNGGSGIDQVFYDGATLGINVNLATGVATGGRAGASTLKLIGVEQVVTGEGADTITGSSAANLLFSQEGSDRLTGAGGHDTLNGGTGRDSMWGGTGNDTYFVDHLDEGIWEKAGEGIDNIISSVSRELGGHQDNLTLTGEAATGTGNSLDNVINGNGAANTIDGESGHDTINGGGGNDTILGGSGDDSIDGGAGADSMIGGSGSDTYFVGSGQGDIVVEELGDSGVDTIITNGSINMADHGDVENLVWLNDGGGGGFCSGNELDNVMSVTSGAGTLTMDGNGGIDTLTYEGQAGAVEVDLEAGNATFVDTLVDMENATGGLGNDTLTGSDVANVLNGSAGADTMAGGYGGDTYFVDDVGDFVDEDDNTEISLVLPGSGSGLLGGDVTDGVVAAIDYALTNFVENLTLVGSARNATGNAEDNLIIGNARNNKLDGLSGADTLIGGAGNDTLVWTGSADVYNGGAGTDSVRLTTGNLSLKAFGAGVLVSVEKVDLLDDEGANILTLTRGDILDMSSTDTLTVTGDSGDQVKATGFTYAGTSSGIDRYTSGTATLLVESDVTVVT
jgi:Ca2+-binding RTX toxin-like protein